MQIDKRQMHELFRRFLTPFLISFRYVRTTVFARLERLEGKIELVAMPTAPHVTNKVVMVTAAGGKLTSEISRQLLVYHPSCILLVGDHAESLESITYELKKQMSIATKIVSVVADSLDKKQVVETIRRYKPACVYHTIADQQLDYVEQDMSKNVYAQVLCIKNIAEAANRFRTEVFVLVSSDKAEHPLNLKEATKKLAELFIESIAVTSDTDYKIIRLPEKSYAFQMPESAIAPAVQQIIRFSGKDASFTKGSLSKNKNKFVYTELLKEKSISQIELAHLVKKLKVASEDEARKLVISIIKQ